MKTRKILILFVLALAMSLLSAVLVQAQDTVELQVNWWGSQNRHDRTIQVIEMFMAENPGVNIVYEFSDFTNYWPLVNTKAAGEQLPCVMQQDYAYLAEWSSRDLLVPLDSYYESGAIDVSNIPESFLAGGMVGDGTYGISLGTNSQSIIIDVGRFEEAGLELPSPDWTWAEFEEISTALHENLGIWAITAGSSGLPDVQLWRSMNLGFGQPVIGEDGTSLGITDWQPTIDHFNMILRLQEAGVIATPEEAAEFVGLPLEQSNIATGLSAMQYQWSNQVVAVFSAAPDRTFKLWHLPRPEGGQPSNYLKPSQFFSITSQCQTPELAADFINFFINDLEANEILSAERGVPIPTPVFEHLAGMVEDAATLETFDFIGRVGEDSSPIPVADPPNWSNFTGNVYGPLFSDPVLYGQISIEEGVEILETEGNNVLGGS